MERVWLHNPTTGGYMHCPERAVEDWQGLGWRPSAEPPPGPPPPVVAEHLARRTATPTRPAEPKSTTTKRRSAAQPKE